MGSHEERSSCYGDVRTTLLSESFQQYKQAAYRRDTQSVGVEADEKYLLNLLVANGLGQVSNDLLLAGAQHLMTTARVLTT